MSSKGPSCVVVKNGLLYIIRFALVVTCQIEHVPSHAVTPSNVIGQFTGEKRTLLIQSVVTPVSLCGEGLNEMPHFEPELSDVNDILISNHKQILIEIKRKVSN